MKRELVSTEITAVTLQTVIEHLAQNCNVSDKRKRDLKSAVMIYANLRQLPASALTLDIPDIRHHLDVAVPARLQISAKRFANLRSDLAAAIVASGLHPMITTARVEL